MSKKRELIREILNTHVDLVHEINRENGRLKYLREKALSISSPSLSGMPRGTMEADRMSENFARISELESKINELNEKRRVGEIQIYKMIDNVDTSDKRSIMRYKYIDGVKKWDVIARQVYDGDDSLTAQHRAQNKHGEALNQIIAAYK